MKKRKKNMRNIENRQKENAFSYFYDKNVHKSCLPRDLRETEANIPFYVSLDISASYINNYKDHTDHFNNE